MNSSNSSDEDDDAKRLQDFLDDEEIPQWRKDQYLAKLRRRDDVDSGNHDFI